MHRIDAPGHLANQFVAGNAFLGIPGTIVDSAWLNANQEEIVGAIEAAGLTPSKTNQRQLVDAILLLSGSSGGQLDAVTVSPLITPASPMRPELATAVVLASRGHQDNPDAGIFAGYTTGPPSASNTVKSNGYAGGAGNEMDGHFWPFQAPFGAQMQGDASVGDGWYPACLDAQGINHYWYPDFLTPPGAMGKKGGGFEVELIGQTRVLPGSGVFHIELILGRNSYGAWNSGDGGETGQVSTFSGTRHISLLSPPMDAATFSNATLQTRIRVRVISFFDRTLTVFVDWQMVELGGAQAMNAVTSTSWSAAGSVNLQASFSRWKVLLKIDEDNGDGTWTPSIVYNTPFGGGGSVPPKAVQDGTAAWFRCDIARATSIPTGG